MWFEIYDEKFSDKNKWPVDECMAFNCLAVQVNQEIYMKSNSIPIAMRGLEY